MVKLRLQRMGRKNYAQWRVVAADSRRARDAKCIEVLGNYDPHQENGENIQLDRVDYWLSVGAQPSDSVRQLINRLRKKQAQEAVKAEA